MGLVCIVIQFFINEEKIDNFYKNWLKILPQLNEGYIYIDDKNLRPTR